MTKETQDYSHSFTDLMSAIAVIFIMVCGGFLIIFSKQEREAQAKLEKVGGEIQDVAAGIRNILANAGLDTADVRPEGNKIRVRFTERADGDANGLFFPKNDYRLGPGPLAFVDTVIVPIVQLACDKKVRIDDSRLDLIVLEGHTDQSPLKAGEGCRAGDTSASEFVGFCNNVRLSSRRATEVFFALRQKVDKATYEKCLRPMFLVSGRGSEAPSVVPGAQAAPAMSPKVNDYDRRVELVFHFTPKIDR